MYIVTFNCSWPRNVANWKSFVTSQL